MFDATFWVAISFVIFCLIIVYKKIPQVINNLLDNENFEWIKYNYGYNFKPQDRAKLISDLNKQGSYENKKKYLETLTDIGDPFEFLSAWYNHYDPSKNNSKHINKLLNNYSGCFGVLYNKLYKKYVNPNWEAVDLWIDDESCKDR